MDYNVKKEHNDLNTILTLIKVGLIITYIFIPIMILLEIFYIGFLATFSFGPDEYVPEGLPLSIIGFALIFMVIGLICMVISIWLARSARKQVVYDPNNAGIKLIVASVLTGITSVNGILFIIAGILAMLKKDDILKAHENVIGNDGINH